MINWSAKEDRVKTYIQLAFMGILTLLIWGGKRYFEWQENNALKKSGITVYANVDDTYVTHRPKEGARYYVNTTYNFKDNVYHKIFEMAQQEYHVNDTLVLKVATDNGNPIFYKIIGVKTNGYTLQVK